ncbi:hypothetical protein MBANPS3_009494 [Mucor bainieri]
MTRRGAEGMLDDAKETIVTKLAAMTESLLRQHIIVPSDEEILNLLKSMVLAILKCCATSMEQANIIALHDKLTCS